MYYRDNSEDYNEKINTDCCDDHDDCYEEFFKKMPYYNKQIPYLIYMYYPMIYSYPLIWSMQKCDEEYVENLKRKNYEYCMSIMNMSMLNGDEWNNREFPNYYDDFYRKPVIIPLKWGFNARVTVLTNTVYVEVWWLSVTRVGRGSLSKNGGELVFTYKNGPAYKIVVGVTGNRLYVRGEKKIGGKIVAKFAPMTIATWNDDLIQPSPSRVINGD